MAQKPDLVCMSEVPYVGWMGGGSCCLMCRTVLMGRQQVQTNELQEKNSQSDSCSAYLSLFLSHTLSFSCFISRVVV